MSCMTIDERHCEHCLLLDTIVKITSGTPPHTGAVATTYKTLQIESQLYQRQGQAVTNFETTLPPDRSDLAMATLKDPYVFDFLSLGKKAQERELENALVQHIEKFLLELGEGFAFVGKQFPLEVGGQDFRLDLLFYHLKLRCYVVIELGDS